MKPTLRPSYGGCATGVDWLLARPLGYRRGDGSSVQTLHHGCRNEGANGLGASLGTPVFCSGSPSPIIVHSSLNEDRHSSCAIVPKSQERRCLCTVDQAWIA